MAECDYERLDPGIRAVVKMLRGFGFETTDSGDGVSKLSQGYEPNEIISVPHVFALTEGRVAFGEADRMQTILGPTWDVEATYRPKDGTVLLGAYQHSQGETA